MKARPTDIPQKSEIKKYMYKWDYADCFEIDINSHDLKAIDSFRRFFLSTPSWFDSLMNSREKIAKKIGLKNANMTKKDFIHALDNFSGTPGQKIALFNTYCCSDEELILGTRDKHLDFCLSFLINHQQNHSTLKLTTTVKFNNWLGKLYFFPVKIVHKIAIPHTMNRMANYSK